MTDMSGGPPVSVVDDSVSPVTHDSDDHKTFPFFDLPPELRNRIYSFSVKAAEPSDRCSFYDLKLVDYFQPSLLRISKQFRHEYEKEVLKLAAMAPILHPLCDFKQYRLPCSQALTRVQLHVSYSPLRYGGLRWIHRKLEECVSVFPSVVTILLRINMFVYEYDDLVNGEYVTTEDLFRLPPVDGGRVKVQSELFLHSRLFKVFNLCQDSDGEGNRVSSDTPMVIFRASPSAGSCTYKGLDLEFESVGIFRQSFGLCIG